MLDISLSKMSLLEVVAATAITEIYAWGLIMLFPGLYSGSDFREQTKIRSRKV